MTHQELADLIGATRETVSLVVAGMVNKGLIAQEHKQITILAPSRLKQLYA